MKTLPGATKGQISIKEVVDGGAFIRARRQALQRYSEGLVAQVETITENPSLGRFLEATFRTAVGSSFHDQSWISARGTQEDGDEVVSADDGVDSESEHIADSDETGDAMVPTTARSPSPDCDRRRLTLADRVAIRESVTSVGSAGCTSVHLAAPLALRGYLWKDSNGTWLGRKLVARRLVSVRSGKLYWYKGFGSRYKGSLDFAENRCEVVLDEDSTTKFSLKPFGGEWRSGGFQGVEQGRVFKFDAQGSEHSREVWVDAIRQHLRHGEETRTGTQLDLQDLAPDTKARPLRTYFLGAYRRYLEMETAETGYYYRVTDMGTKVLVHEESGISTWARALDLCPIGTLPSEQELTFHYAPEDAFRSITDQSRAHAELWASLMNRNANWGEGVYTSSKEPVDFGSREAVAHNNYATQLATDPSSLKYWADRTAYCIPVLAPKEICFDVRVRATPEMKYGPARNVEGKPLGEGREVWVVRATDENGAIVNATANNRAYLEHQVVALQARVGEYHLDTLASVDELASCLAQQERYAEAERLARRAYEGRERALGRGHHDCLASASCLAFCLQRQRRTAESEALVAQLLEASDACLSAEDLPLGEQWVHRLLLLSNFAAHLEHVGRSAEAEAYHRRALELQERCHAPEDLQHPDVLMRASSLASCFARQKEAESLHRRVLRARSSINGQDHPDSRRAASRLASCLEVQSRAGEAAS
mmetsp:Transcript_49921/g.125776  ORF Transcript_49921/g.125776 Transcript_49921/m.125776 type:complete len:711 (-) Transcript_49921:186-2318(-)